MRNAVIQSPMSGLENTAISAMPFLIVFFFPQKNSSAGLFHEFSFTGFLLSAALFSLKFFCGLLTARVNVGL